MLRLAAAVGLPALLLIGSPARAEGPNYPAFTGRVVDDAHVLSDADKADIDRKLKDLQARTGVQLAVATVPSLGGSEIEPYANGLFRNWGLGQKGSDNGLLMLLAPKERRFRIEVGRGLEGTFTDLQSSLIQRNTIVPKLKAGDAGGALRAGVDDAILVLTADKASLPPRLQPDDAGGPSTTFIIIAMIIIVIFIYLTIRGGGLRFSSGFTSGAVIGSSTGGSWSSEASDVSSDNDGFTGGGGGDSGGGGSSSSY